ncbi:MAG: hypothetical protein KDE19_02370 [Caldilineaceae bacterium]|nr:hypothetical protein [Caldilineaceae bacterium]
MFSRRRQSDYTILDQEAPKPETEESTFRFTNNGSAEMPRNSSRNGNREDLFGREPFLSLRTKQGSPILTFPTTTVDAHRYMVTRLLVNQELPQRTAIVSAIREEGVTYNALALATLLACDTPKRICYVDLNWWYPAPQLQTATKYNRGIAALLQQNAEWNDTLVATNYGNLSLLPAGDLAPQQRAVTARSGVLAELLAELSAQFDHLVLDVPAILTTSDAIPLAALADAGCVVIRHGVSSGDLTKRALADIAHLPMLGVIMNRTGSNIPAWLLKWIPQE